MLVCISRHADTDTLCFRSIILKRVNSSELVVQKIVYLAILRPILVFFRWAVLHRFFCNAFHLSFDMPLDIK